MKTLDEVSARMFPTLDRYARRVRRRSILALIALTVSAYIIGRDVLSGYQMRVAKENMAALPARIVALEDQYQRDHHTTLTTTKAQSAVLVERMRREKE
ncbi:MAG: hypothetical protein KGK17_00970 [Betaproteobacteria bacterium]|nr:hypothetical protein [Betaproteobacteria bacterium]